MENQRDHFHIRSFRFWNYIFTILGISVLIYDEKAVKPFIRSRLKLTWAISFSFIQLSVQYLAHINDIQPFSFNGMANSLITIYTNFVGNLTIPLVIFASGISSKNLKILLNKTVRYEKECAKNSNKDKIFFSVLMTVILIISYGMDVLNGFPENGWRSIGYGWYTHKEKIYTWMIALHFAIFVHYFVDIYIFINKNLTHFMSEADFKKDKIKELTLTRRKKLIEMSERESNLRIQVRI